MFIFPLAMSKDYTKQTVLVKILTGNNFNEILYVHIVTLGYLLTNVEILYDIYMKLGILGIGLTNKQYYNS